MKKFFILLVIFLSIILSGQAQSNPQLTVTLDDALPYTPQNLNVGDEIIYTITVANTGNETLQNVIVSDNNANIAGNNNLGNMVAGQTETLTATHVVTQSDIDNGHVSNTAISQGFFNGNLIDDMSDDIDPASPNGVDDPTITYISQNPGLTLFLDDQLSYQPQNLNVGDEINYVLSVLNSGNVTLSNIVISFDNAVATNTNIASLAPGDVVNVSATHTITQTDIDAGQVVNQATGISNFNGTAYSDLSDDNASNTVPDEPTITLLQTNGINDYLASKIKVYPTVATDYINVLSNDLKIEKIKIVSISGQIQTELQHYSTGIYPVSGFSSGTYLLEIKTDKGTIVKKIILR